jgi:hypothetical protein
MRDNDIRKSIEQFPEQFRELIERQEAKQAVANYTHQKALHRPDKLTNKISKNKFLYFILCRDAVKIGISIDPTARLESLATGAPGKLMLLAMIENAGDREKECHKKMAHLHIHREWFRYTNEIDLLINELS